MSTPDVALDCVALARSIPGQHDGTGCYQSSSPLVSRMNRVRAAR
jgi:hypothetical protein